MWSMPLSLTTCYIVVPSKSSIIPLATLILIILHREQDCIWNTKNPMPVNQGWGILCEYPSIFMARGWAILQEPKKKKSRHNWISQLLSILGTPSNLLVSLSLLSHQYQQCTQQRLFKKNSEFRPFLSAKGCQNAPRELNLFCQNFHFLCQENSVRDEITKAEF